MMLIPRYTDASIDASQWPCIYYFSLNFRLTDRYSSQLHAASDFLPLFSLIFSLWFFWVKIHPSLTLFKVSIFLVSFALFGNF